MLLNRLWATNSLKTYARSYPLDTVAKGDALTMRQGALLLQVKWKGYDDPSDQTLEPEENLLYAV